MSGSITVLGVILGNISNSVWGAQIDRQVIDNIRAKIKRIAGAISILYWLYVGFLVFNGLMSAILKNPFAAEESLIFVGVRLLLGLVILFSLLALTLLLNYRKSRLTLLNSQDLNYLDKTLSEPILSDLKAISNQQGILMKIQVEAVKKIHVNRQTTESAKLNWGIQ